MQALRYTLPDENEAFDTVLRSHLVDMLKIMLDDPDMEIRRHAMSTLNSAAHNKPGLILGHLGQLVPYVMNESIIKPELVREVQMGPFKHLVDDGLEVRKASHPIIYSPALPVRPTNTFKFAQQAAYETLYALMETAFSRISIIDLYDRVIAGLKDDNDIRGLCNLMVSKLAFIDPDETNRRLDSIAEAYRVTLSTTLKESAVKQELEKQEEANKSVLRVSLLLGDRFKPGSNLASGGAASGSTWDMYWAWVNKDFSSQLKSLREESKEIAAGGSDGA